MVLVEGLLHNLSPQCLVSRTGPGWVQGFPAPAKRFRVRAEIVFSGIRDQHPEPKRKTNDFLTGQCRLMLMQRELGGVIYGGW